MNMKKILFILPLLLVFTALFSCADNDERVLPVAQPQARSFTYTGELQVGDFTLSSAVVVVEINKNGAGYMDIEMSGVKFSEMMPVTLDVTLRGIPCTETDGRLLFAADNIVPFIGGNASEDYKFALLTGWINADATAITFVAQMADDLAAHVAGMVFVYTAGESESGGTVTPPPVSGGTEYEFTGTLQVGEFILNPAAVSVVVDMQAAVVDIKMSGVKFSDRMPLVLDITLCGLACENVGGVMRFAGQNVVPLIGAEPSESYTFASVTGEYNMRSSVFTFSARMADNLAAFVAGKEFTFSGTLK